MEAGYPDLIDTHAHVTSPEFDMDRDEVIGRAKTSGVGFIEVGFDVASSRKAVAISKDTALAAAVGIHPHNAVDYARDLSAAWKEIEGLARSNSASVPAPEREGLVVAIGEIGLDYHRDLSPRGLQAECFEMGLDLAKKTGLPVIVHERDAEEDTLAVLRNHGLYAPIIFHCFGGGRAFARRCLELGGYLGFGGIVTYPKNAEARDLLRFVPFDRILLETDSPYLAPQSRRGRRNEPANILETRDAVASALGLGALKVGSLARDNALTVFHL